MKIAGPPGNDVADIRGRGIGSQPRSGRAERGAEGAGDRVALSDRARWLAELKGAIGDPLAVDEARVAELRDAIGSGTYDPSPRQIAESLLRELPGLGRR
jgi:flagellar biosynthesis anti-sigma factor FlgM